MSSVLASFIGGLKLCLAEKPSETVRLMGLMPVARELRVSCSNIDINQHLCSPYIKLSLQSTLSAVFRHRGASQSLILLLRHKPQQYFYHINILL